MTRASLRVVHVIQQVSGGGAARIAVALFANMFVWPSTDSARRTVITPTFASLASSSTVQRTNARAALICAPVIINHPHGRILTTT